MFDLDDDTYTGLMTFSKKVAAALEKVVDCERVGMFVIGLEVPHVHVHLIPLRTMADATFTSKTPMESEMLAELSQAIAKEIS